MTQDSLPGAREVLSRQLHLLMRSCVHAPLTHSRSHATPLLQLQTRYHADMWTSARTPLPWRVSVARNRTKNEAGREGKARLERLHLFQR